MLSDDQLQWLRAQIDRHEVLATAGCEPDELERVRWQVGARRRALDKYERLRDTPEKNSFDIRHYDLLADVLRIIARSYVHRPGWHALWGSRDVIASAITA